MEKKYINNYAFIDSQNLNLGVINSGWILDFRKFRVFLKHKYKVKEAFLCLGFVRENKKLYKYLRHVGFRLYFKPTSKDRDGNIKGNVDADLVLKCLIEKDNYNKAVLVTGDGDFYNLIDYLQKSSKLLIIIGPSRKGVSHLIKRDFAKFLVFLDNYKKKVAKL